MARELLSTKCVQKYAKDTDTQIQNWSINANHSASFIKRLKLTAGLNWGLASSPILKCLGIFCHGETLSVSHYSFIAHLGSAPCNQPQTSQITSPDKKQFVGTSPNLSVRLQSHSQCGHALAAPCLFTLTRLWTKQKRHEPITQLWTHGIHVVKTTSPSLMFYLVCKMLSTGWDSIIIHYNIIYWDPKDKKKN